MFAHVFGAMWYAVHATQALRMRNVHKEVILVLRKSYDLKLYMHIVNVWSHRPLHLILSKNYK